MTVMVKVNKKERGAALVMALFALLLLSAIGGFMLLSARTETRIDSNYSSSLRAYYGANAGLVEVRDRMKYPSSSPGGMADLLPTDIAGNSNGVLYVLNPSGGEVIDPTNPASQYFDSQLCHDYNSGADIGSRCTSVPTTAGWSLAPLNAAQPQSGPLPYKWVRINMKTNRQVLPNYCVDQPCTSAQLDTRVCWDGKAEQLSPGGTTLPACDANGMQTVYMLTALGATPGVGQNAARKFLRAEVVAPSIRTPGAITMDAAGANPSLSDGSSIPGTLVDGRPHDIDGKLASGSACSQVAALATDSSTSTSQLSQELNAVRMSIVQTANASCNWDGTGVNSKTCTPALWWVRGTDTTPRFGTTTTITTTTTNLDGDGDHKTTTTTSTVPCDSTNPSCYTNLNLGSPELQALPTGATMAPHMPIVSLPDNPSAPFIGGPGNQGSGSMYQSGQSATLPNEVAALATFVNASNGQPNYNAVSSASLAPSYGTRDNPAIVVITDTSLKLPSPASLSGYGVLVVPNDLEVNSGGTLQWTGIVLVQGGSAQFKVSSGGSGTINGALILQPSSGSTVSLVSTNGIPNSFRISYSCDAIDMAFSSLPFKLLSSTEFSF